MADVKKAEIDQSKFNPAVVLPYELRRMDFEATMQDVYDFFYDMNSYLLGKGLQRLDDMLRPANLSGTLSDMITDALGKHSRTLTPNVYHNGHPDLIVKGAYAGDAVKSGEHGVEIKSTNKRGGAVDTHGGRNQTLCVWVYEVDRDRSLAARDRDPLTIREIYINQVTVDDFRKNARGELGTRTATLGAAGIARFRQNWVYKNVETAQERAERRNQPWRAPTR